MKNLKNLKNTLVILLATLSFSGFSQTLKVNEQGQVVKKETTVTEVPISTTQIDAQVKSYKQMIYQFSKKIEELNAIRSEVAALEEKSKVKVKARKQ